MYRCTGFLTKTKILPANLVRCNGVGNLIEEVDGKKSDGSANKFVCKIFEDWYKHSAKLGARRAGKFLVNGQKITRRQALKS